MKNNLSNTSRILTFLAAISLIVVLFVPMWSIELNAPQYPEGLNLSIHANGLRGNVEIINGLNHYIGMKTLHDKDFIEFTVLPYCIIAFSLLFALVAFINKRKLLNIAFGLFVVFGIVAMIDFWRWEYNYGHNLNPNAAIIVPGMSYQPPLIGFKQLLNFGAYSIPDLGGWIFIGAGLLLLISLLIESYSAKKKKINLSIASVIIGLFFFSSCETKPIAILVGKDACYFCKMTISDAKFGAEIVTKKGKVYKFDDIHCLNSFIDSKELSTVSPDEIYVVDFAGEHQLVNVNESFLLQSDNIFGPMNGNIIAFKNKDSLKELAAKYHTIAMSWEQLSK